MPPCGPDPRHLRLLWRPSRRPAARRAVLAAILTTVLSACAERVDPTPFADSPDALPRPAADQAFPRLRDVPDRPADLPTPAERQQIRAQLEADRAAARALAPDVDPDAPINDDIVPTLE